MEDISRELEREIARIRPAPHKRRKVNNILIVNEFGEMRSGDFLKALVYIFLVISIVGGLCSIVFYQLYSKADDQNIQLRQSQDVLEEKVDRLTSEKELLMARLVVTGNTAELEALTRTGKIGLDLPNKEKKADMKGKESSLADDPSDLKVVKDERSGDDDQASVKANDGSGVSIKEVPDVVSIVSIESFSLSPGNKPKDIVVRFNIRNTTQNAKEISGRIFCVLKPKGAAPDKWVVIPKASVMDGGVPGPYGHGHYFSISRFKPVRFTINTATPLQGFTEASVFIFDEAEKLLSKTTFDTVKK
ncbi:hypothetical protein [uncultured Desulfobacter sp.]|uniref:hypothetical protein n=1 Tax=uncultured Desulfobacter sp. TaxID=240139 RepID=UPI002AAB8A10|nr:hypothetical protein [uncultured Desulfobacter sp.]